MNEYELKEHEAALINEYIAAIAELQQQMQGALRMVVKANALDGDWFLQGNKLVNKMGSK